MIASSSLACETCKTTKRRRVCAWASCAVRVPSVLSLTWKGMNLPTRKSITQFQTRQGGGHGIRDLTVTLA